MGLRDKIRSRKNVKSTTNESSRGGDGELIIQWLNGDTVEASRENALKLSAVYSAISTISNTMSKLPFFIINRKTKKHIEDDALYELLNLQPNDKMNSVIMHQLLWTWVLTDGNAYCYVQRGYRSTKVDSLIPISPDKVTIVKNEDGNIFYDVQVNGKDKVRCRYDEIIHLKAKTINGVEGISPLTYGKLTIQTGLNQENFSKDFYENYGRPSDYLKTPADLSGKSKTFVTTDENGKRIEITKSYKQLMREEWEKTRSGGKRFGTAILDNGLDYATVPQLKQSDMEFVSSKQANVEDIARFFDMASCSFKLGIGKQTYSNNEQGQICYVTETIVPKLKQWESELTLKILTKEQREKGWVVKGNLNEELRGDTASRANWYDKMRSMGVYNINEIRAFEDMPSIGEQGETRLIGANSIPLEKLLAGKTASSVTPNPTTESTENKRIKEITNE